MKRDLSYNSLYQTNMNSFLSPKNSSTSIFKSSRPQTSRLKISSYSYFQKDCILPSFSPRTARNSSNVEPEKLILEKTYLQNIIKKLNKELFLLKQENLQKINDIKDADMKINYILEYGDNNYEKDNSLMNKIRKYIKNLKQEIYEISSQNEDLKKNNLLTQINEYTISNEIIEEQINKIYSLIQNAKEIQKESQEKINQSNQMTLNIENQNIILNQMNKEIEKLNKEENKLNLEIQEMKNKILKDKIRIKNNKNIVISLKKQNTNLLNESKKTHLQFKISNSKDYINKISEIKKGINHYKKQIKISDTTLSELKIENEKLKKLNNENLNIPQKTSIIITNSKIQNLEDERIEKLKESLKNSKAIEKELENQILIYQNKLNELQNENYNEQIEFGIDSNNPYFSPNEDNNPIETSKLTSIQFNQFTYILFKNFEAKNINLDNSKSQFINEILNNINREDEEEIDEININSEKFISIINQFTESIINVLNCRNDYNIKILTIYIGALLFNSNGSLIKLCQYFSVLFSYTKQYESEIENKLIEKLNRKYKDKVINLLDGIKEENTDNNDYFPLINIKNIIDEKKIDFKDKYIEFIFYLMKKFDDPKAKLSDLKISNLTKIIESNNNEINDDINNDDFINNDNKYNIEENNDIINDNEQNNIIENENVFENNENETEDSMTEISNEEFEKLLQESFKLINNGLIKVKKSFEEIIENYIKEIKSENKQIKTISVENLYDALKEIDVNLSDMQLSCICSKYSIPENLRIINIDLFKKEIVTKNDIEEDEKESFHLIKEENKDDSNKLINDDF